MLVKKRKDKTISDNILKKFISMDTKNMKINQNGFSLIEIMLMTSVLIVIIVSAFTIGTMVTQESYVREIVEQVKSNNPNETLTTISNGKYALKTKEQRIKLCKQPVVLLGMIKNHNIISTFSKNNEEFIFNSKDTPEVTLEKLDRYSKDFCNNEQNAPLLTFQVDQNSESKTVDDFKKPENKWKSTEAL